MIHHSSFSLCRHFVLESGVSVRLTLEPGDCHEEDNTIDDSDVPELTTLKPVIDILRLKKTG